MEGKEYVPNPISTGFILERDVPKEAGTFLGFGTRSAVESNLIAFDTSKGKFKLEAFETFETFELLDCREIADSEF